MVFDTPPSTAGTLVKVVGTLLKVQAFVGKRHRRLPAMRAEGARRILADEFVEQNGHWRCDPLRLFRLPYSRNTMAEKRPMKKHFMMFAAYNAWANGRIYEAAAALGEDEFRRDTGAFFKSLMGTLNHILVADRVWMKRFTGEGDAPASLDTILFSDFAKLRAARETEDKRIVKWIGSPGRKSVRGAVHLHDGQRHAHDFAAACAGALSFLQPPDPSPWPGAHDPDGSGPAFRAAGPDLFPADGRGSGFCVTVCPGSA